MFTEEDHQERKLEDLAALKILDAEHLWLGHLDAPYRNNFYSSFENIIFGQILDTIPDLNPLIESIQPATIIAPLAVGNHVDHRITFEAVQRLRHKPEILYYEDQPYASVQGATTLRLNQLGYAGELNFEAFWESFLHARYVQAYLPMERHQVVRSILESMCGKSAKRRQAVHEQITRGSVDPILAYKSQLKDFIRLDEITDTETFWKLTT